MYYDNQSVIQVVYNIVSHSKMKHFELHAHYLRQLVHDNIVSLEYCRTDDHFFYIFTKYSAEAIYQALYDALYLGSFTCGGCHKDIISPLEYLEMCVDGGVLEHQALMVHHTSLGFSQLSDQPTSRYS